jgi:hypothetical protein
MSDRIIDVDLGTALAVQTAKEHITDQAEKLAYEAGLNGSDFDDAVAATVASKQPYLETFSQTIRTWLAAGGHDRISFNADGSRKA